MFVIYFDGFRYNILVFAAAVAAATVATVTTYTTVANNIPPVNSTVLL